MSETFTLICSMFYFSTYTAAMTYTFCKYKAFIDRPAIALILTFSFVLFIKSIGSILQLTTGYETYVALVILESVTTFAIEFLFKLFVFEMWLVYNTLSSPTVELF